MENQRKRKAVKENVPGDFYVEHGCCTICGIPQVVAPKLFGGFDEVNGKATHDQCFVKKQPETLDEFNAMFEVLASQELNCIRYCGTDNVVRKKVKEVGGQDVIDWV